MSRNNDSFHKAQASYDAMEHPDYRDDEPDKEVVSAGNYCPACGGPIVGVRCYYCGYCRT